MEPWHERSEEEANLFNPSFCALLLIAAAKGYAEVTPAGMPFALTFLVLPITLHRATREGLPRSISTTLPAWLKDHPELQVGFPERASTLVPYTREALQFGIARKYLGLSSDRVQVVESLQKVPRYLKAASDEVRECAKKAYFVGRWLAYAGSDATVMALWGVRP